MPLLFPQIALIGVGLIGGSLMLDCKKHGLIHTVIGIDTNQENLDQALTLGVIDEAHTQINAAIARANAIFIATPVNTLPDICAQIAPFLSPNTIVSDVGSTKQSSIDAFREHCPAHFAHCVAAHPIAGSERSGVLAAHEGLFFGKKLILCPHERQSPTSLQRIEQLWQTIGAHTYHMHAAQHDAVFAAVSHFPHLLAFSYMHQILDDPKGAEYLHFAGSGFRDFTRIAASSAPMWKDIFLANRDGLLHLIAAQQQQLTYLERCLRDENGARLHDYLEEARQARERWQS